MGSLGVHFAIDDATTGRLVAAGTDEDVAEVVAEIEEAWDRPFVFETDKAWDAVHRCLTDGTLDPEGGSYPLSHAVLGGHDLYEGEDYFAVLVRADQVPDVAKALAPIDEDWLRARYEGLEMPGYEGFRSAEDFAYTWSNFQGLGEFFAAAAEAGRAVVFTVDQ